MAIEGNIGQINVIVTTYDLASKKVDSKFLRHLLPVVRAPMSCLFTLILTLSPGLRL